MLLDLLWVYASLLLYRQILDEIEANDYDNFIKKAYVTKAKKLISLQACTIMCMKYVTTCEIDAASETAKGFDNGG